MRLTIERMRTLVLAAAALLILALVGFLTVNHWKHCFNLREIPKRLGIDIEQESNGVTYSQARGGHTLFKIHASKVVQLKQDGRAILHDVQIELYGEDGSRVDRIVGDEFEYDQKNGVATAAGPVEITLMRPGVAPAVAPKVKPGQAVSNMPKGSALQNAAKTAATGEIRVKTSGLTYTQKTGLATTAARVEFEIAQGSGSSMGATFDSGAGHVVLDHAVELNVRRGADSVVVHAQNAEFERGDLKCNLKSATASYHGGQASAGEAQILFRPDGSAVRLDAANGFSLTTALGARVAAPTGTLEFDEHNQPKHGRLAGGVTMDSASNGRVVRGSAPTAELEFNPRGELHHAHLERGVNLHSDESNARQDAQGGAPLRVSRDWRSPVLDMDFRNAGKGHTELGSLHGTGGVVVTGESQRGNGPVTPSRMAADQVTGQFGAHQQLSQITGVGHAALEQATAAGARQRINGDRLDAHFAPGRQDAASKGRAKDRTGNGAGNGPGPGGPGGGDAAAQIQTATVDGNVVLVQDAASKPGAQPQTSMRATSGRAVYEGAGEWLHLTLNPRVEDGGLQLTADKLDVSQASGDAFARGNVKATWVDTPKADRQAKPSGGETEHGSVTLGGQGPAHVVAAEAQLHQSTGEATFRGEARLWQQANSISAPVIVLDRDRQTLVARSTNGSDPVRVVLVSAANPASGAAAGKASGAKDPGGKPAVPSVIRVRGADFKYSDAERKVVMHGGAGVSVVAETSTATSVSNEVELVLLPPGNHAGKDGGAAQVDRLTARGRVQVSSQGRRGTGEQLVYSSETGEYVLTGTAASPPRMTDPARGTVTGEALIFNSRDDSVNIEGNGRKTTTDTTAPK